MRKATAIFSILMGLAMSGTWGYLLLFDQFPGIRTAPLESRYLVAAEFLTAFALVVSGSGVLLRRRWSPALLLAALGALTYCTVRYAGELGQSGSLLGLAFFSSVALTALFFAVSLVAHSAVRQAA